MNFISSANECAQDSKRLATYFNENFQKTSPFSTLARNNLAIQLIFVFFVAVCVAYWQFSPWEPKVFFADDLYSLWAFYDGVFASTIQQSLSASIFDKYRPVFQLLFHFLFSVFDKKLILYLAFNLVMQGLNSVLFFLIASRLSKNKFIIPFVLTLAFASSRLALYQVTQVIGPVESVAFAFFLAMIYAVLRSLDDPSPKRWQWLAILSIALCIYTHERYVVVIPWLVFILFYSHANKSRTFKYRCSLALACLMVLGSNLIIKVLLLHIPFFVGTGGYNITIDIPMILTHTHEALLSLVGFNDGPAYLIGNSISINPFATGNPFFLWFMAAVFSLSFVYVNARAMMASTTSIRHILIYQLGFFSLISLLLMPPILTIRVEGRWEYAPFALILLSFASAYGLLTGILKKNIGVICIIASIAILIIDNRISQSFDRIYMVGWAKFGNAIRTDMIPPFTKQKNSNEILLLADQEACGTVKINRLFELDTNRKPIIFCAESKEDLTALKTAHPNVLAFEYNLLKFTQTTTKYS